MEIWKTIDGFNGKYLISSFGRVMLAKGDEKRIISQQKDKKGYMRVGLYVNHKTINNKVHRLVAATFIPNPNNYPQVNHKDENKSNNHVENLEWCTCKYNIRYGTGKQRAAEKNSGERNNMAKLKEEDVRRIRSIYIPGDKENGKRKLAEKYHVSYETITKIVTNQHWKHLLKEERKHDP